MEDSDGEATEDPEASFTEDLHKGCTEGAPEEPVAEDGDARRDPSLNVAGVFSSPERLQVEERGWSSVLAPGRMEGSTGAGCVRAVSWVSSRAETSVEHENHA